MFHNIAGDLVDVVFKVYEYLLHEPVLDSLRIEEVLVVITEKHFLFAIEKFCFILTIFRN